MKNQVYLQLFFVIFLMSSCTQNEDHSEIVLQATGFPDSTKIYLMNLENDSRDSGYITNNELIFSVKVDEPTPFVINTVYISRETYSSRYFWKEKKQVNIYAENGKLTEARIEGSEIQKQADMLDSNKSILTQTIDSLQNEYRSVPIDDVEKRKAIRSQAKEIEQAIIDVQVNYVHDNPEELFSAYTLKNLMKYTIPKDKTNELFENLSIGIQSSKYGTTVKKFLELSTDFEIGDKAMDFQLPDLEGNLMGLSSFKGKYILLDFWSSNCGPCLMENPNLLKNYKAYKDRGFEIIGICLDKNKEDWANTVKKYSMIWTTVSDLKSFDGDVPLTYHVFFIPTYYLIDPNGVIIEKIEGRGQLDEKIKNLFPD